MLLLITKTTKGLVSLLETIVELIFDRSWAILLHLKTDEELVEMEFQQNFDWSYLPNKKFKKV